MRVNDKRRIHQLGVRLRIVTDNSLYLEKMNSENMDFVCVFF